MTGFDRLNLLNSLEVNLIHYLSFWLPDSEVNGTILVSSHPHDPDARHGDLTVDLESGAWRDIRMEVDGDDCISLYGYLNSCTYRDALVQLGHTLNIGK